MVKLIKLKQLCGSIVGDMFVCQPPVIDMFVTVEDQEVVQGPITRSGRCLTFQSVSHFAVFNSAGVRIGDIARAFAQAVGDISVDSKLSFRVGERPRTATVLWVLDTMLIRQEETAMFAKAATPAI
jgi:hypothetical protein